MKRHLHIFFVAAALAALCIAPAHALEYTIDPATQTQTVKVNPQDTQTLTFYNAPQQTLTIQKYVDGTTDPIQGVTFLVTDSSGAVVGPNNGEYIARLVP